MRKKIRSAMRFFVPLLAGAAFIFGAVRYWDIEYEKVVAMVRAAVLLVFAMAVLALLAVVLVKALKMLARRGQQKK